MGTLDSYLFDLLHLSSESGTVLSDSLIGVPRFITHLGDGVLLAAVSLCALGVLLFRKHYRTGFYWTLTIVFSFLFSAGLKKLIGRQRPDNVYHLIEASSPAMPSGHALKSTVVYVGIYFLILRFGPLTKSQKHWAKLILILPVLIGLSRVFLGVHWPSDVVVGWTLGIVISCMFNLGLKSSAKIG